MAKKTAMDCVKLARDPKRPHLKDFIKLICSDFEEETGALLREFEPCRTPSAIGRSRNRPSATRGTVIGASRNSYRSSAS